MSNTESLHALLRSMRARLGAPDRRGRWSRSQAFPWTDDQVKRLRELWADETISTAEIGHRLGTSKGSVIGKAHRLDLPPRLPFPKRRAA